MKKKRESRKRICPQYGKLYRLGVIVPRNSSIKETRVNPVITSLK